MTYEQILARQPVSTCREPAAAREYVSFLSMQMQEGINELTDSQRAYLYKLRSKWQDRADGKDHRWLVQGRAPGRPAKSATHTRKRFRSDEESDPLLASLLKKYGSPRREDV